MLIQNCTRNVAHNTFVMNPEAIRNTPARRPNKNTCAGVQTCADKSTHTPNTHTHTTAYACPKYYHHHHRHCRRQCDSISDECVFHFKPPSAAPRCPNAIYVVVAVHLSSDGLRSAPLQNDILDKHTCAHITYIQYSRVDDIAFANDEFAYTNTYSLPTTLPWRPTPMNIEQTRRCRRRRRTTTSSTKTRTDVGRKGAPG